MQLTAEIVRIKHIKSELKRELKLRKNVYPQQIRKGKMTQREANNQTLILEQILEHFNKYDNNLFINKIKNHDTQSTLF